MVSDDEFRYAESEKDIVDLLDWQRESVEQAKLIMYSTGNEYIRLPDKHEVNEYRMMEHFIMSLELGPIRDDLWNAIEGRGAFRRFKDRVYFHGLDQVWCKYRDKAFKTYVKEWCESNKIEFEE